MRGEATIKKTRGPTLSERAVSGCLVGAGEAVLGQGDCVSVRLPKARKGLLHGSFVEYVIREDVKNAAPVNYSEYVIHREGF